ncbi:kelch-like protein 41 isoform X2 [Drosophila subpulchrella]|uniref:kelch-like protein 41 isoform X2 n=1 Tax=Drosophila subpulchrella TaxID=1486046 RepID=UPI0018A1950F|nr:kelch-like protein 41 isoform X2 [Drosophila subpulchrella]
MDRIVSLSELKQDGGKPKVDQAKIDGLTADLAAAIKGTYMWKGGRELKDKEPGQKLTIEPSLSNQDLIIGKSDNINVPKESFNSEKISSENSLSLGLEPLNLAFSILPKPSPSSENLNCWQPPKEPMDAQLLRILKDPESCSFRVYVGKYKFRCHLQVLQAHSKYFQDYEDVVSLRAHLPTDMVTPTAFHVIYNWMLDITKRPKGGCSMVEIYSATTFLKIDELLEFAFGCFNESCVSGSLAFGLFLEAQKFEISMFQFLMLSRIDEFFLPLVASKEFVQLDFYWVRELLSIHSIGVNSEIEIFMTAVRWLSYDWNARKILMEKIMGCVRFCLLPALFLRFLQGEHKTLVMNSICQSPKIREKVNKAFVYTSSELCDMTQRIFSLVKQFDTPEQRKWIFDKRCPYHRKPGGNQGQFFTYQQFLNYLESLHDSVPDYGS